MSVLLLLTLLLPASGVNLSILRMSDGRTYPEPCAVICSGVESNWRHSNNFPGKLYMKVDMSDCNFVSTPIITATADLSFSTAFNAGGVVIRQRIQKSFYAYVDGDMNDAANGLEMMWTATGYNCS